MSASRETAALLSSTSACCSSCGCLGCLGALLAAAVLGALLLAN